MGRRTIPGTLAQQAVEVVGAVPPGPEVGLEGGKVDRQRYQVLAGKPPSLKKRHPPVAESLLQAVSFVSLTTMTILFR